MRYTFDPAKAASNAAKHGVEFSAADEFEWETARVKFDMRRNTSRRKALMPTKQEDARINAGIAADPDNPELGDDFWRTAKPAAEFFGPEKLAQLVAMRRPRGRPPGSVAASRKVPVTMRVDPEVLDALRGTGDGWQTRANEALRKAFVGRAKRGHGSPRVVKSP